MKVSKPVLYSRLFLQIIIIFLGTLIIIQAFTTEASLTYRAVGFAVLAYGLFRFYQSLSLLFRGRGNGG
ncbi:MAG: hypothetical protein ACPLPS_06575 [bacterium]